MKVPTAQVSDASQPLHSRTMLLSSFHSSHSTHSSPRSSYTTRSTVPSTAQSRTSGPRCACASPRGMSEPPAAKRRRGGQRARLAQARADDGRERPAQSALARALLYRWAWGELSPQQCQALARAAVEDFGSSAQAPQDLLDLAALGCAVDNTRTTSAGILFGDSSPRARSLFQLGAATLQGPRKAPNAEFMR